MNPSIKDMQITASKQIKTENNSAIIHLIQR
jgi:hypothetical protein